jgi:uncharacterized protein (UPF0264 family)
VSVRSAREAVAAVAGGAAIIDVKEPRRGPLGRADVAVWSAVRSAVPQEIPVSVALGELDAWGEFEPDFPRDEHWAGIAYRKIGLAASEPGWPARWARVRQGFAGQRSDQVGWIAVIYADWQTAGAPEPESVVDVSVRLHSCVGVLIDTWDKKGPGLASRDWSKTIGRVRTAGRMVAIAGSLDRAAIERLRMLEPDYFAVRGAACIGGDRNAEIDPDRVASLLEAIG